MSEPTSPADAPRRPLLRRVLIVAATTLAIGAVVVGVGGVLLYRAATAAPPEYEALLVQLAELQATGELDEQRQVLESQVAALYSEAQSKPRWKAVLTADQINGWLTMQLPVDFPKLQRRGVRKPRVLLSDSEATIACRAKVRGVETVVALSTAPIVAEDGWVGLVMKRMTIGRLPLPLTTLTEMLDEALRAAGGVPGELRYRWAEMEGSPVLLLDVEHLASTAQQVRRVDMLEVRAGELLIGGVTEERAAPVAAAAEDESLLLAPSE